MKYLKKFLICFAMLSSMLGQNGGNDFLAKEAELAEVALFDKAFLDKKERTPQQKKNITVYFNRKTPIKKAIPVKTILEDIGYPDETWLPFGSTGDLTVRVIWEYRHPDVGGKLLRFKMRFSDKEPKIVEAYQKVTVSPARPNK